MTKRDEAVEAYRKYQSVRGAARALGKTHATIREHLRTEAALRGVSPADFQASLRAESCGPGVISSLDQAGVTPSKFRLVWVKRDGVSVLVRNPEADETDADTLIESLTAALERFKGAAPLIDPPSYCDSQLSTVYTRGDFHIGLLTWKRESGKDWDLKTAIEQLGAGAQHLVSNSPPSQHAMVLGLGDFLHIDNTSNETFASRNKQDADGRYMKILEAGMWLEIAKIQLALAKHKFVGYIFVPGNHDPHASQAILLAVSTFFHNNPRVKVYVSPKVKQYWRWGKVLNGATHGHTIKQKELPGVMSTEQPKLWGICDHKYFFSGHLHHDHILFHNGVHCIQVTSPVPPDAYHASGKFSSHRQIMHAFVQHREYGQVSSLQYTLPNSWLTPPPELCTFGEDPM